jgi:hypothetical protein
MPGDSGVLVVARVRSTTIIAHETAGAAGIRHSPRPPWGRKIHAKLGRAASRDHERAFCSWLFEIYPVAKYERATPQPSSPANGSAEWPPDDRLRRAIQYSRAVVMKSRARGVLDTPLSRSMTVFVGSAGEPIIDGAFARPAGSQMTVSFAWLGGFGLLNPCAGPPSAAHLARGTYSRQERHP